MQAGDIVECLDYGLALVLGPCEVPSGVPETELDMFLTDPESWPTEQGWAVQLLEEDNMVMLVHTHNLHVLSEVKE
jgi:hypothetical protein|tara:strand:- start:410 stop:637 length:228 start_codon:yes stop_codon:yes gene_type:complete